MPARGRELAFAIAPRKRRGVRVLIATSLIFFFASSANCSNSNSNNGVRSQNPINVTCSISENVPLNGTPICSVREQLQAQGAIDPGMQLRYEMVPVSNAEFDVLQLLELNVSTGLLSTARRAPDSGRMLDRERSNELAFLILVDNARVPGAGGSGSGGRLRLSQTLVVSIVVRLVDENDNAPSWPLTSIRLNFSETDPPNSTRLFRLATDRDVGAHAELVFRKSPTRVTYVNGSSVLLRLGDEPFRFSIARRSIGSSSASTSASSSTSLVGNSNSVYRKDAEMGLLTLIEQLDAETTIDYRFELVAVDNNGSASGSLSATATVIVRVGNVNEHAPVFSDLRKPVRVINSYTINVSESQAVEQPILTVHASDADIDSYVTYLVTTLDSATSLVGINELTGEMFLSQRIDYESLDASKRLVVLVLAVDSGLPAKTSSVTVTVNVMDENDNVPQIRISCEEQPTHSASPSNVLAIEENTMPNTGGATDCRVAALDVDSGVFGQVNCFVGRSASDQFVLSEQHASRRTPIYRLAALSSFDFESVKRFDVPIECRDGGNKSSTSLINVVVTDVNDCAPQFTQTAYTVRLLENSQPDAFVTQVRAVDPDTVATGVVYQVTSQKLLSVSPSAAGRAALAAFDERQLFSIDSNGIVRLVGSLDREAFESVVLQLRAVDAGNASLSSTAALTVMLVDVNDNPPVVQRLHQFIVSEDAPIGTPLGRIEVTDADMDADAEIEAELATSHARFSYQIVTPACDTTFRVEEATGLMLVRTHIERLGTSVGSSLPAFEYLCQVNVTDGTFYSITLVNVTVLDANDHAPVFQYPSKSKAVLRLNAAVLAPGSLLATISAVDADFGANAVVRYSFVHPTDLFDLEEISGVMRLKRPILISDGVRKQLLILATDQGKPQKSATAMLTVFIDTTQLIEGGSFSERTLAQDEVNANSNGIAYANANGEPGRFTDNLMNVLVTISLVAVSACLLATFLTVFFLVLKRYTRNVVKPRQRIVKRMVRSTSNHGSGNCIGNGDVMSQSQSQPQSQSQSQYASVKCGKRHVSIIDSRYYAGTVDSTIARTGNSSMSASMLDELPHEIGIGCAFDDPHAAFVADRRNEMRRARDSDSPCLMNGTQVDVDVNMSRGDSPESTSMSITMECEEASRSCRSNRPTAINVDHIKRRSYTPLLSYNMMGASEQYCTLGQSLSAKSGRRTIGKFHGTHPIVQRCDSSPSGKTLEFGVGVGKDTRLADESDTDSVGLTTSAHVQTHQEHSFRPSGRPTSMYDVATFKHAKSKSIMHQ